MRWILTALVALLLSGVATAQTLSPEAFEAMKSVPGMTTCYHRLRALRPKEGGAQLGPSQAHMVATMLNATRGKESLAAVCGRVTWEEAQTLAVAAPSALRQADGVYLEHVQSATAKRNVGNATDGSGRPTDVYKLLGTRVDGIPYTFVGEVTVKGLASEQKRFKAQEGTILIVPDAPTRFQYVVVLKGVEFTVGPNETRKDRVWLMCIENGTAPLPSDHPLQVGGVLPLGIIDTMQAYRDGSDGYRRQTRDATIRAVKEAVREAIGS